MTARRLSPTQANMLRAICHGYFAGRSKASHKHVQALDALRNRGFVDGNDQPTAAGLEIFPEFRPPLGFAIWHLTGPQGCGKTRFAEIVTGLFREHSGVAVRVEDHMFLHEFSSNPARVADQVPGLALLMLETNCLGADGRPNSYLRGDRIIDLTDFDVTLQRRPEAIPISILLRLDHPEWSEDAVLVRAKALATHREAAPC